jgi:hypothetical protein
MKVHLKRDAFIGASYYRTKDNPVIIPDALRSELPKDAKIVGEAAVATKKVEPPQTLRDFDGERAAGDAVKKKAEAK